MAKPFAKPFYRSKAWKDCRNAYVKSVHGLCESCYAKGIIKPGDEVHHIIPLTEKNINDPRIALSFNNLIFLCHDCHMKEHELIRTQGRQDYYRSLKRQKRRRYTFDSSGRVIERDDDGKEK